MEKDQYSFPKKPLGLEGMRLIRKPAGAKGEI